MWGITEAAHLPLIRNHHPLVAQAEVPTRALALAPCGAAHASFSGAGSAFGNPAARMESDGMAELLNTVERDMCWPRHILYNIIVLYYLQTQQTPIAQKIKYFLFTFKSIQDP